MKRSIMKKILPVLLIISILANLGMGVSTTKLYQSNKRITKKYDQVLEYGIACDDAAKEHEIQKHECKMRLAEIEIQLKLCQSKK